MTRRDDNVKTVRRVVVFFDICSSSAILEDLAQSEHPEIFRNMMLCIRDFLHTQLEAVGFLPYKFIGDGWVLLFPENASGATLINFLDKLSRCFKEHFRKNVRPYLQHIPNVCGLTFGVDEGNLVEIVMNDNVEYLGRALNVASRLQGSIKDNDKKPAYKVLLSRPAFKHLRIGRDLYKIQDVGRRLRNIYGGAEMKFVKVWLPILEKKP